MQSERLELKDKISRVRYLLYLILIWTSHGCAIKTSNNQDTPIEKYVFSNSKYQLKNFIDSIVFDNNKIFYADTNRISKEDRHQHLIINFDYGIDTISYKLYFAGNDLEWVNNPDSTVFVLNSLSKMRVNLNIYDPRMHLDDNMKEKYKTLFDSLFIDPLEELLLIQSPYEFEQLSSKDEYPLLWRICKDSSKIDCEQVKIERKYGTYIITERRQL
ncbi:MAG: hypothetical protein IIA45_13930 [Bacteroidetes bacterium]|nr:hypothetical protein [Bacteroidota bacterium]